MININDVYYTLIYNTSGNIIEVGKVGYESEVESYGVVRADRSNNWWYEYSYQIYSIQNYIIMIQ